MCDHPILGARRFSTKVHSVFDIAEYSMIFYNLYPCKIIVSRSHNCWMGYDTLLVGSANSLESTVHICDLNKYIRLMTTYGIASILIRCEAYNRRTPSSTLWAAEYINMILSLETFLELRRWRTSNYGLSATSWIITVEIFLEVLVSIQRVWIMDCCSRHTCRSFRCKAPRHRTQ